MREAARDTARALQTWDAAASAQLLGISVRYLKELVHQKKIRAYFQANRLRFPAWSILEYEEKRLSEFEKDMSRYRKPHMVEIGKSRIKNLQASAYAHRKRLREEKERMTRYLQGSTENPPEQK